MAHQPLHILLVSTEATDGQLADLKKRGLLRKLHHKKDGSFLHRSVELKICESNLIPVGKSEPLWLQ